VGDGGCGFGDWGLGFAPIPNPQSPIPNPQSPIPNNKLFIINIYNKYFIFIYKNLLKYLLFRLK